MVMSSTATRSKSNRAVLSDTAATDVLSDEIDAGAELEFEGNLVDSLRNLTTALASDGASDDRDPDPTTQRSAEELAGDLNRLVQSVATIEELSQQARQAAATDYETYASVRQSADQYRAGLAEAVAIHDQVHNAHERAFGAAAKSAAEPLLAEATQIQNAFEHLSSAWEQRAARFLDEHPDVQVWLAEQHAREVEARREEAAAARNRRLESLVAAADAAISAHVISEAQRVLGALQREFEEESSLLADVKRRVQHCVRAELDDAARRALAQAADDQARGDIEAAVAVLESVAVHGLSREVSEDVFGLWSDACSRLAQSAGASVKRFSPIQGRGLILYEHPSYSNALLVFSSLGMGRDYPHDKVVTDPVMLRRSHPFREAAPLPQFSWFAQPASVVAPAHH
jgi:hypothetical protein